MDRGDGGALDRRRRLRLGLRRRVGAVAGTYVVLAGIAALVAGRAKRRSRDRRMRQPWERGLTEWQPTAWTYHRLEEVLIGAALVSLVVCMVLFVTVGGFSG
jgi:hypothetical protein